MGASGRDRRRPRPCTHADMSYHARFRCIAGCHGEHPLTVPLYRCPTCGDLLEVVHDLDALKDRSPAAWMRLFDDRYKRTTWPFGSAVWGKKEWVIPSIPDECIVSMDEGGTNMLWAERYGKSIGVPDLWIKQCGNSHTGSFKDLGMTVLVSVVRQMQHEGKSIRAVACASTGDTSASLGGLRGRRRHPGDRDSAARQGVHGAAAAAARQRRAGARARHRLRRLHGDRPAALAGRRRLPRELDEQPAARRPEDGGDRDRAAVGLGGAGRRGDSRRQPGQRQRARRRLRHDDGARPDGEETAHRRRAGGSARIRCIARISRTGNSSRWRRSRRWRRRFRSATRSR